jgi:hypothetical protein
MPIVARGCDTMIARCLGLGLVLALLLGACSGDDSSAERPTTTTAEGTTTTSRPVPATGATSTTERPAKLTGFGATRKAWDAAHDEAAGYADGAVYLPNIAPGRPKYATVCCDDQIISYTVYLPEGTTPEIAEALVADEFPPDAVPGEWVDLIECKSQVWRSPTLDAVLNDGNVATVTYFPPDPGDRPGKRFPYLILLELPDDEPNC